MLQQDSSRFNDPNSILQYLRAIRHWLFDEIDFSDTRLWSASHWTPKALAFTALVWGPVQQLGKIGFRLAAGLSSSYFWPGRWLKLDTKRSS